MTGLTLTMIAGMIIIVGLLLWRLGPGTGAPLPLLPAQIPLRAGETLTGYAQNPDWVVLITTDDSGTQRLHLLKPGAEQPHQTVQIAP